MRQHSATLVYVWAPLTKLIYLLCYFASLTFHFLFKKWLMISGLEDKRQTKAFLWICLLLCHCSHESKIIFFQVCLSLAEKKKLNIDSYLIIYTYTLANHWQVDNLSMFKEKSQYFDITYCSDFCITNLTVTLTYSIIQN